MYKLLVVDDEYNIREGLACGIPWHRTGVEVVGTAVDGEDAYNKVMELSPDIVITDVSMDNMNGLDLADLLRQNYPLIKVIILSGYDDFEFVSRALELKVFTYIIKPVHSEELINVIQKLISEIEDEKKLKEKIRIMELEIDQNKELFTERFLYDLINGNIENNHELDLRSGFLDIRFENDYYTCVLIEIPDYREIIRTSGIKALQSHLFCIRGILCDKLAEYDLFPMTGGTDSFVLVVGSSENDRDLRENLVKKIEKVMSDITLLLGITASVSIGGIYNSMIQISKSYKEALLASQYNSISARASVITIYDIQTSNGADYIYPAEKENLITGILNSTDEGSIRNSISYLFDPVDNHEYSKNQMRIVIMGLLSTIAKKAMEMGVDIYQLFTNNLIDPYSVMERYSTRNQIENWLGNVIAGIQNEIRNKHKKSMNTLILKANTYMNSNYSNSLLSLTDVANHIYLNASYFSRLYKNETGESFVEALTRIRINSAKELLKDSNVKISAISEKIGYPSNRYFCSVFKKHLGLTPMEYRKSM